MANLEELVVSIVAETAGLRAELQKATAATKDSTSKMQDAIEEFSKNSSKNVGFFETAMATMTGFLAAEAVQAVMGFAKDGLGFLKDQLEEGAKAAIAEENALKRLANSLALSGQYSNEAMKSLQGFTAAMEEQTGIGDDVVASNLAMLSSLTKLDAEGLKRAQKAALDMSAALGMDLDSATQLVAKGIEGNVAMFKRYGVSIEEGANKAENFANVMAKLESSFGGAAAGAAQTFGGAVKGLSNSWGNLTEALATTITKNPVVIAMMNELTTVFSSLVELIEKNGVFLREVLASGFIFVANSIGVMAQMADSVFRGMMVLIQGTAVAINALVGGLMWAADKLGIIDEKNPFNNMNLSLQALNDSLENETALGKMATVMADVGYAGTKSFNDIAAASNVATASIKVQGEALDELSGKEKELYQSFLQGLADKGAALDAQYAYENELRAINTEIELQQITDNNANKWEIMNEDMVAKQELLAAQQEKEWADLNTAYANKLGSDSQYAAARTALTQKQALEAKKIELEKTKFDQAEQQIRLQGYSQFFDGMAVLQQSSSKELVAIGKAAAITKTTIDAYVAIQNALANVPFPANIAAAAGIGIIAFANVAKIAGIGFNEGGTLQGGGANMDSVPATLTKGETVVTRDLTGKLEDFLNRQQQGGGQAGGEVRVILELKDGLIEMIEAKILERQATNVSLLGAGVV